MSNSNFRTQDVPSKLEETVSFLHNSQGDLAVSSFPCSSASIVHPDCTSVTALTSESSKPTMFARQPISNKKHNYLTRNSMKVSFDSSKNSHLLRHQRSSIRHAKLGKLIPQSEGSSHRSPVIDTVPSSLNVKPMAQVIPIPKVDIQSQASIVSMTRRENVAPSSQCKRMIPQPARPPSAPYQQRCIPAPISARPPLPASPLYIKRQGFDEPPKTIEQKCNICKRDLSFTAEGRVYQPAVPPFVAVLPCGHTFHDHCLQTITPQDQLKDPPCIPCALGET